MGFFNRLFGSKKKIGDPEETVFADTHPSSDSEIGLDAKTASQILSELDIDTAIAAHERWKQRLLDYVNAQSDEVLQPEVVCMDDRCDLGKWLYGAGGKRLGQYPAFSVLVARHQYFHAQASNVVILTQQQRKDEAMKLIDGKYSYASKQVVLLLKELKRGLVR